MMVRTLFMTFITLNTLSTYNCFSMKLENEEQIITLDQGLLTTIPGKIIKGGYKHGVWTPQCITKIDENKRKDTLINRPYA